MSCNIKINGTPVIERNGDLVVAKDVPKDKLTRWWLMVANADGQAAVPTGAPGETLKVV